MSRGYLIVFEGIDGCGKTTQANLLYHAMSERGLSVMITREPSHSPYGQCIRTLASQGIRPDPQEELALFQADRKDHVARKINPALDSGRSVILDRYYFSTLAYQGARGLDVRAIQSDNELFAPRPDIVFLLDIPISLAVERIAIRGQSTPFEKENVLKAVDAIFATFYAPYIVRIDASAPWLTIHARICDTIRRMLNLYI